VQKPELFIHQEQKENYGAPGIEEVLPALPQTSGASRNQVK
jgi:hypothetical protein